jgi:hypothetical protein
MSYLKVSGNIHKDFYLFYIPEDGYIIVESPNLVSCIDYGCNKNHIIGTFESYRDAVAAKHLFKWWYDKKTKNSFHVQTFIRFLISYFSHTHTKEFYNFFDETKNAINLAYKIKAENATYLDATNFARFEKEVRQKRRMVIEAPYHYQPILPIVQKLHEILIFYAHYPLLIVDIDTYHSAMIVERETFLKCMSFLFTNTSMTYVYVHSHLPELRPLIDKEVNNG